MARSPEPLSKFSWRITVTELQHLLAYLNHQNVKYRELYSTLYDANYLIVQVPRSKKSSPLIPCLRISNTSSLWMRRRQTTEVVRSFDSLIHASSPGLRISKRTSSYVTRMMNGRSILDDLRLIESVYTQTALNEQGLVKMLRSNSKVSKMQRRKLRLRRSIPSKKFSTTRYKFSGSLLVSFPRQGMDSLPDRLVWERHS